MLLYFLSVLDSISSSCSKLLPNKKKKKGFDSKTLGCVELSKSVLFIASCDLCICILPEVFTMF